jgi:hypothetical protein
MAEMRKGLGGMGKMGSEMPGKKPAVTDKVPEGEQGHDGGGEEGHSTITHHADGTHTSEMHGGEAMQHPDHKHLMAHIGHHLTGGDAHHVMHHDGMEEHHHSVEESGEHHDGELNGMGGEMGQEEQPQDEMEQQAPMYGGM